MFDGGEMIGYGILMFLICGGLAILFWKFPDWIEDTVIDKYEEKKQKELEKCYTMAAETVKDFWQNQDKCCYQEIIDSSEYSKRVLKNDFDFLDTGITIYNKELMSEKLRKQTSILS